MTSQRLDVLKGGRDAEPRQQTLRATIEWSFQLLKPEEQRLFRRLAVFRGGCSLEVAEAVADADLDTLASLVDKSLLRRRNDRLVMLETLREFAAEQLEASGEGAVLRQRHAEYFLALAEEAEPHLRQQSLDRLTPEIDNFRAAFDRLSAAGESELVLRLSAALWRFWFDVATLPETAARLEQALRADERPSRARAYTLNAAALSAGVGSPPDLDAMEQRANEAHDLHAQLGDEWGMAYSRDQLSMVAFDREDFGTAARLYEESAAAFRRLGDTYRELLARTLLSFCYGQLGQRDRATALNNENLARSRATGNRLTEALGLEYLAELAIEEGRPSEALIAVEQALSAYDELGYPSGAMPDTLSLCASALAAAGDPVGAVQLIAFTRAFSEEKGFAIGPYSAKRDELTLGAVRAKLSDVEFEAAWDVGARLSLSEAVALVRSA